MPWADLTTQPRVRDLLQRSLRQGRAHHAYLFVGEEAETEGLALAFAQALNCEARDGDCCGRCESCSAIAGGRHPDIHVLRPESKSRRIVIAQVRGLEQAVYLKASHARTKVAIVHAADRLQPEAQDAFLKTLEEPPGESVLLLLTDEPQQLKETILSRCLRVPFHPSARRPKSAAEKQVEDWLAELHSGSTAPQSEVIRAYALAGRILQLLAQTQDENRKAMKEQSSDPSLENLEPHQRKRLEEELIAQAQSDYVHERSRIVRALLEWYHANRPNPRNIETLETLARRLGRNANESLAFETAILELAASAAGSKGVSRQGAKGAKK